MSKHQLPPTSPMPKISIQDLMGATRALTDILVKESEYLDSYQVTEIAPLQDDKARLTKQLEMYKMLLDADASIVQNAPANQKEELLQLTDDLAFTVEENFRRTAVARAVNQRVMQAVMDVMNESQRPGTYDRMGQASMPANLSLSMSLNERGIMSLNLALNNAVSGLRINQKSLGVLSQNIANVNTEGYSRQIISQSAINVEGVGSGVRFDDITRKVDKYLQRSVLSQGSTSNASQTISSYYQRVQDILGQPGAGNSIDEYLTTFFSALQNLSNTPDVSSSRTNTVSAATTLASQISDLAGGIEDLRYQADRDINELVTNVNLALAKLTDVNINLGRAEGLGQSLAALEDERDAALRTLSENMDISVTYNRNGTVSVLAGNGVALVEEGGVTQRLSYAPAQSINTLINGSALDSVKVLSFNSAGGLVNTQTLISAGVSEEVTTGLTGGKLAGLQKLRDDLLPDILSQLDMLASRLRDDVNAIHNGGSGFPPATTLTGERPVRASDDFEWVGSLRIAVLQSNGSPVQSGYANESDTGVRPLLLDLGSLDSGQGAGKPTIQNIIDEINNHFAAPSNKVELGNLNNIRLASSNALIPETPPLFNFDIDVENISRSTANVFVTNVTVLDDTATNITNVTQTAPSLSLSASTTYTTVTGTGDVTVTLQSIKGLAVGDTIYLNSPSLGTVNGITAAQLTGYFTINSIAGNQITITTTGTATASSSVGDPSAATLFPAYSNVAAGVQTRTGATGKIQVDLSGNTISNYYDITLDVGVVDEATGAVSTSQVTYRVPNNQVNFFNKRISAASATGAGTVVIPQTTQESMRAILVDADGNELPKFRGQYVDAPGYVKLIGGNNSQSYSIAIDELDSKQLGKPSASPAEAGTGWGFSHFFGLNNLFKTNGSTLDGEVLKNSAINLEVSERIQQNTNLVSVGDLVLQNQPADSAKRAQYTYVRYAGNNGAAQRMAQLSGALSSFDSAGGLPASQVSLQTYTSQLLGLTSSKTSEAKEVATNAQSLFDGFKTKSDAVSNVNLDEELANTIVYQNAYSASARVVTVVNSMFDSLIQMIG